MSGFELPPQLDGETIGDRLLAGSIFIDVALQSLKSHSEFGVANKNGEIQDLVQSTEDLRARYLKLIRFFPASSLQD